MPFTKRSIWSSWKPVDLQEIKAFLGVIINMALNPKPEISDYFSNCWIDYQPFYKDVFSKRRFLQIFWNLHVTPPDEPNPMNNIRSRSGKMKHILQYLEQKFRKFYTPNKHVSIDESTIGFKGRVSFRVYNKDKPTKWGIKVYVLADSLNGYVFALEPYFGSQTTAALIRPDLPVTVRLVVHLTQKLLDSGNGTGGYHVFTDRYYTSPQLAKELLDMGVNLTGTVMTNRKGLPPQVKPTFTKKMKKGDLIAFHNTKLSVLSWRDKRVVTILSTVYDDSVENVERRTKTAQNVWINETIKKPTMICQYNKYMGGVDVADHYATTYAFGRKTSKWWRKVFFWLFDVAMNNAFILYKLNKNLTDKYRSRQFRKKLVEQLIGSFRSTATRRFGRSLENNEIRLNGQFHALAIKKSNLDCKVCSDRSVPGGRKTTVYYCKSCPDHPALHPVECFEKYHTLEDFK